MILQNFLQNVVDFINNNKQQIQQYATQLKASKNYNNFDLRLSFDLFYYQQATIKKATNNCDFDLLQQIATACNIDKNKITENHIFTLYKNAIKTCNILQ